MRPVVKAGLIAAGYLLAFLAASAVVAVHVAATSSDRVGSDGMYAFGDLLFFIGVFALASVPPTGGLLYVLRPLRAFWRVLSVFAVAAAVSAITAVFVYFVTQSPGSHPALHAWSAFSVLVILAAPVCALGFLLSGCFAPSWSSRLALLSSAAIEATVFGSVAIVWFSSAVR